MADRFGTPYSEALHVAERYRLIDYDAAREAQTRAHREWPRVPSYAPDPNYRGKGLQLEFTVTDPGTFTTPWKGTITYLRSSNKEWYERVCAENIQQDRKSTRLNSSHLGILYAVFCLKKKREKKDRIQFRNGVENTQSPATGRPIVQHQYYKLL